MGRQRQRGPWDLSASQCGWVPGSNHKVRVIEKDINTDLVPPYVHAPVCACTHAHTHAKINLKNYFFAWYMIHWWFFLDWLWKPKIFDPWKRMIFLSDLFSLCISSITLSTIINIFSLKIKMQNKIQLLSNSFLPCFRGGHFKSRCKPWIWDIVPAPTFVLLFSVMLWTSELL